MTKWFYSLGWLAGLKLILSLSLRLRKLKRRPVHTMPRSSLVRK
jgi:hypothetical protein